jgi:hypothetical protein
MIISHSRKFTFVHLHKAGGTSVEIALDPYLSWNDLILGSTKFGQGINKEYRARHGLFKHSSVADIERICGSAFTDDFYLFALVRHPVDRICSLYNFIDTMIYNWKVKHDIDPDEKDFRVGPRIVKKTPVLNWPASRAFRASRSFSGFIRHADLTLDPAFHTQVSRLVGAESGKLKGEIFRLEDGEALNGKIGSRLGLDFHMLHANRSARTSVDRHTISSDDRQWLEERFREDFAAFNY